MPLDSQKYQKAKALLDRFNVEGESSGISPEVAQYAQQRVDQFESEHAAGQFGTKVLEEGSELPQVTGVFDRDGNLASGSAPVPPRGPDVDSLDPSYPIIPQALAAEPSVAGPGEANPEAWLAQPETASSGTVFVYEAPLSEVKKRLLENPQLIRTLLPDFEQNYTPDRIAQLTEGDPLVDGVRDDLWKQTADAARTSGKTAYRYSKAPWLHEGNGLSKVKSLLLKFGAGLEPALETVNSYVMGYDDMGYFRAGKLASEAASDAVGQPSAPFNERSQENNPEAFRLGQAHGMLSPVTAGNALWNFVASGGKALVRGGGAASRLAASGGAGAAAGAVGQATQEGVDALAAMQRGEQPSNPVDALRRIGGVTPFTGGLGMLGDGIGALAREGGEAISGAYGGRPARAEQSGVRFRPVLGPKLSPQSEEFVKRAKEMGLKEPVDIAAADISPQIAAAAKQEVKTAISAIEDTQQQFFKSSEGRRKLAPTNTLQTSLDILRGKHAPEASGRISANAPGGVLGKVRGVFNGNLANVSVRPIEGAIPLSLEEAEAYLTPYWKNQLQREVKGFGKGESVREGGGPQPYGLADPQTVDVRPAVDRELLPEHGPARDAQPGIGPDKPLPRQPFNDTRGELARQPERVEPDVELTLRPKFGPAREAEPGLGLQGRPVPEQPFGDTRGELAREQGPIDADLTLDVGKGVAGAGAAYAATSDDGAAQGGGVAAIAMLPLLKKRGMTTVYVVPKRFGAMEHEQLIRDIKGFHQGKGEPPRELQDLDQAARKDRDQRPMGGQPEAWSQVQNEHAKLLDDAKAVDRLVNRNNPDGAFQSLVGHSQPRAGELLSVEALRRAADTGGVRERLDALRGLQEATQLRDASRPWGGQNVMGQPRGALSLSRVIDPAALTAYPIARTLGSESGPIRGGRLGAADKAFREEPQQESDMPKELRGLPASDPRVQQWLRQSKEARP